MAVKKGGQKTSTAPFRQRETWIVVEGHIPRAAEGRRNSCFPGETQPNACEEESATWPGQDIMWFSHVGNMFNDVGMGAVSLGCT